MTNITDVLRAARACIQQDRTSLADTGMRADNTMEPDAAAGVAEYDAVLAQIDGALASMTTPESLPPARWYSVDALGMATLCADEDDAIKTAAYNSIDWPNIAPHRAMQLAPAALSSRPVADSIHADNARTLQALVDELRDVQQEVV